MSDTTTAPTSTGPTPGADRHAGPPRRRTLRTVLLATAALLALTVPFIHADKSPERFWIQLGLFSMAAAASAMGLTLLLGQAGQLSLGHSFFVGIGAYGYTYFAGDERTTGTVGLLSILGSEHDPIHHPAGLGLPPLLAAILAVALAGFAGLLFSPVAARLHGIYLGIASLGLVFIGLYLLDNAPKLTGTSVGRSVAPFSLFGLTFKTDHDNPVTLFGVELYAEKLLWLLFLIVIIGVYVYYRNLVKGRPGRALRAVRDRELMAEIMGIPVSRFKGYVFLISSMYAGLGGVLYAIALGRIAADQFGPLLAIQFLVMAVIGGLGSPGGAIAGAVFVTCLPQVLKQYADNIPGLARPGESGIDASTAAQFIFGGVLIAVLLLEPGGLAAIGRRLSRRGRRVLTRTGH